MQKRLVHIKPTDTVVYQPAVGSEQPMLLMVTLQPETGMPIVVAGDDVDKMQTLLTAASVYHDIKRQMQQSRLAQQGFALPPGAMARKKKEAGDGTPDD